MRIRTSRIFAAAAIATVGGLMFSTAAHAVSIATLMPAHVGSTAADFPTKECNSFPGILPSQDGWHFVLPSSQGDSIVSITLDFSGGAVGPITSITPPGNSGPGWSGYIDNAGVDFKHVYVLTTAGQTLLGGTAEITPDGKVGSVFNLSHTCAGTAPTPSGPPPPGVPTSPPATVMTTAPATPPATPAPSGGAETGGGASTGVTAVGLGALAVAGGAGIALFLIRRRDNLA